MKTQGTTDESQIALPDTAPLDAGGAEPGLNGIDSGAGIGTERLAVRGDALAVALYRFLQSRPEVDLRHVLNAVAGRRRDLDAVSGMDVQATIDRGEDPSIERVRVALCRMSLEAAAADLHRFPVTTRI